MNGFTSKGFLILMTVIFPLLLLGAAVYLDSNICVILGLFIWIGVGLTMLYIPHVEE